jgi:hypothetical protein
MNTRTARFAGYITIYVLAWATTWINAADALSSQVRSTLGDGWKFEVTDVKCPAPLIFKASSNYVLTSHEGNGEVGWFCWTPWRIYTISCHYTWIS